VGAPAPRRGPGADSHVSAAGTPAAHADW
jgi:hypothetical protein